MLKGLLARMRHKYGPLPLWAWTAIAGTAGALYWRLRKPPPATAEDTAGAQPAYAFGESDFGDTGAGEVGGVGPVGGETAAEAPLDSELAQRVGDLAGHVTELEDAFTSAGYERQEDKSWLPPSTPGTGGEEFIEPDTGAAGAPAGSRKGVPWYGRTFATKAGLAKELAKRGYRGARTPAQAFKLWAKLHPGAAKKLGGKAPVPHAKPGKGKAPARPSSNTRSRQAPKHGAGTAGARPRNAPKAAAKPPARPRPAPARKPAAKPKPKPKPRPGARR